MFRGGKILFELLYVKNKHKSIFDIESDLHIKIDLVNYKNPYKLYHL